MARIPTKDFSKKRMDLIAQMRWLLNEMEFALSCVESGEYDEAAKILRKETQENYFIQIRNQTK
ncbi:hypothetical protein P4V43_12245 [Brevibacillus fortis]|uniref:hypothetical protein n=1 Tax=Brevibacillus fortis TaxID=2126352 RepID=UPI002E2415CA|nr:hypothetical protein [Brevibacillus fortis]